MHGLKHFGTHLMSPIYVLFLLEDIYIQQYMIL